MAPEAQAILESWSAPLGVDASLCIAGFIYAIGWIRLHRVIPNLVPPLRLVAYLAGIFSMWIAIGSPIEALDDLSLSVHMVQHLLLMAVAPPLLLLGAPALPLLQGLPRRLRRAAGRLLARGPVKWLGRILTNPAICWIAASMALVTWHIPAAFELALRSDAWHKFEHACFFVTSVLFWWPVIRPFPGVARRPRWPIPLYLFLGTLPGGALGAFLTFCDRILYPSYAAAPMIFYISPLEDQVFAGALMWVFGTMVYMVAAVILVVRLLNGESRSSRNEFAIQVGKATHSTYERSHPEVI
jgi:cytochrome c oxidase assembly factor CtaG